MMKKLCLLGFLLALTGCQVDPVDPTKKDFIDPIDPSAERLHDLGGQLLRYKLDHRKFPERIDELKAYTIDPNSNPEPICPVSGKEYIYVPSGIRLTGYPGMLMVYAPEPTQNGLRPCLFLRANQSQTAVIMLSKEKFDPKSSGHH